MLVLLRSTVSLLGLWSCFVIASNETLQLKQDDMEKPEQIEIFLKHGASKKQREMAESFFAYGKKRLPFTDKTHNWGPILKAFGESAIHNPTPKALLLYAEAQLRSWKEWSNPEALTYQGKRDALKDTIKLYDSALIAQRYNPQLTETELAKVKAMRTCMNAYIRTKVLQKDCEPLRWVGLQK